MISPKKLMQIAKAWQRKVVTKKKTLSFAMLSKSLDFEANIYGCVKLSENNKGHFVIYTAADQTRFVIPLAFLDNEIFREMLRMSEDEFGLPRDGPITLPCDAVFMKYIVMIMRRGETQDFERTLLMSMATTPSS